LLDEAHAHAVLLEVPYLLAPEVACRFLEPPEDLQACPVVQRLQDFDLLVGGHTE
jgi:hypothetical protein